MKEFRSDISGFYKLTMDERHELLSELLHLNPEELEILKELGYFMRSDIQAIVQKLYLHHRVHIIFS